ncbi:MAG: bacterial Ig-like domain-containing protein, partial [Clostridiales bacterium]|nr:bacterial Ig-like domain-containing protein [Clostridiales bacterium]
MKLNNLKRLLSAVLAFVMTVVSFSGLLITPTFAADGEFEVLNSSYTQNSWSSNIYLTYVPKYIEEGYVEEAVLKYGEFNIGYYYVDGSTNIAVARRTAVPLSECDNIKITVADSISTDSENTMYYSPYTVTVTADYYEEEYDKTFSIHTTSSISNFTFDVISKTVVENINENDVSDNIFAYPIKSISITPPDNVVFYKGNTYSTAEQRKGFVLQVKPVSPSDCYFPSLTRTSWDDSLYTIQDEDTVTDDYLTSYYFTYFFSSLSLKSAGAYTSSFNFTHFLNYATDNRHADAVSSYTKYDTKVFTGEMTYYVMEDSITSIDVTTQPTKVSYIEGETFKKSGMVVTATYMSGKTATITGYSYDTTPLTAGQTEVYITYDGLYTTVPVTVSEKEVSSISITTQPTKTDYIVGQSFDDSGMAVTAVYTDGTKAKIDNDLLTYTYSGGSSYFSDTDGEYITVSYAGKTADTDTLTVKEKTAVSIAVTGIPSNLNFYTNETYTAKYSDGLDTVYNNGSYDGQYYLSNTLISRLEDDGLELTVHYNDGTSAVISNTAAGIRLDGFSTATTLSTSGTSISPAQKGATVVTYYIKENDTYASVILITYDDVTTSIPITVLENELTGISVTTQPNKTSYSEGDSFDPDGMVVMATYADGSEEEITDYSYSSINGTGSVTVYVTYGSFYDTVIVNVEEAKTVTMTGIIVSSSPTKTTYVAGENFDKSGMVIEATYSNGSTTEITDYSYSPTTLSESDTSVIVTYGNYYTTIPISVSAKEITKIEVTTAPTKTEYVQGEVFDSSGMIVTATYSDGTFADLASSEYSYSTEALTTLGNIDFEISAANCTATTPITVIEKEISLIAVTQYPDKVSYYDGQSFDSTGMIVQASYNDGSTAIISDYSVSPTVLTSGDTEVTVSKDGFSDVVKITVSEKSLSKIAVTSQPSVISYIAGETFNSSGMTVTAYYNDNSSETITDYTITNPIMTAGTDTVYITYGGLYTTVSVTVTEKTVTGIEVSEQPSK